MRKPVLVLGGWLIASIILVAGTRCLEPRAAHAAVTPAQRREHSAIKVLIRRAEQRYKQGQLSEAASLVRQAQQRLTALLPDADKELRQRVAKTVAGLTKVHRSLEFEGLTLEPLKPIVTMITQPTGSVGFAKDVAPILIGKCGRCHIDRQQGEVGMATFADLMKGSAGSAMVLPKDADGSRLVEVIETGDMPRGGLKVTAKELAMLKQWIRDGAKFDGGDPTVRLTTLAPDVRPAEPPQVKVDSPDGTETISFSRDLAAILSEHCVRCHGDGQPVRARLDVTTFRTLLRGGDNGPPIVPKAADESLLLKKLKGTAEGDRMPQGQPPLADDVIAKFATWVNEGARFDGRDTNQHVREIAAIAEALKATHEQLRADRVELALANWRLVMPDDPPKRVDTDHLLLLGNIRSARLTEYGSRADALIPRVAKLFKAPPKQPLIKGGITLFFFEKNYDYGEFSRMVEKRALPPRTSAHWRYTTVDAYAALHVPRSDEEELTALLARQISGLYVASLGKAPRWFYQGVARAAAARIDPKSVQVVEWNQRVGAALAKMKAPDDFLHGRIPAEDAEVLAFSYARLLMSDTRRFQKLLNSLRGGDEFEAAFKESYGTTPDQAARFWAARESNKARSGRRRRPGK